jgi:nucleotide-binding universal stress UspA family protein
MTPPIVAGTDGSEASLAAVAWAAVTAVRHRVPLCLVHVEQDHPGPAAHAPFLPHDPAGRRRHELPHHVRSTLARASRRAIAAAPGVDMHTVAVGGRADQMLCALTARTPLLAIGTRGAGGFPGLGLGSVALHLASNARCPVVFATAGGLPTFDEIVVGTDGSDDAAAALEFGFGEADLREARLTALHAWAKPQACGLEHYHDWLLSVGMVNKDAAALLAEQVAPWRHKYPDVLVTETTVHGHPGRVLALASGHADLVVVGGGRGGPGLTPGLGRVVYALLHHAQCPVAVIPGRAG